MILAVHPATARGTCGCRSISFSFKGGMTALYPARRPSHMLAIFRAAAGDEPTRPARPNDDVRQGTPAHLPRGS